MQLEKNITHEVRMQQQKDIPILPKRCFNHMCKPRGANITLCSDCRLDYDRRRESTGSYQWPLITNSNQIIIDSEGL